jgi:GAF domain-containing protein
VIAILRGLQDRREALVTRSGLQRAKISARLAPAASALAAVDRVVATLRAHPAAAGIAAIGVALVGPRKLLRWAVRAGSLYALLARIQAGNLRLERAGPEKLPEAAGRTPS